jgi:predicted methyltransferase
MRRLFTLITILLFSSVTMAATPTFAERVAMYQQGEHRSDANVARNEYRHPSETLAFFGIEDGMTVMEIWPGGGWYTEILAPAMRNHGKLIVATWDTEVEGQADYRYRLPKKMKEGFSSNPELYDQVEFEYFSPPQSSSLGDSDSLDAILTFRNTHGWVGGGLAETIFAEFARVLKPGGVLGVVQHRAEDGTNVIETAKMGYVSEEAMIKLAADAGLAFEEKSEVNANPDDSKDYPEGVWTLPPSFELDDLDKEKYAAIGESDRMTLRFRKPR